MTKEEYQRDLVRLFDSLRTEYKGDESCKGIRCIDCPFQENACFMYNKKFNVFEVIEILEQWGKEHPIMTNARKFKEVFGFTPIPIGSCVKPNAKCEECDYYNIDDSSCDIEGFWDAEYEEPQKDEQHTIDLLI